MTHIDFQEMMLQHKVWVRIGLLRMLVAYQGMICNDKDYTRYRIPCIVFNSFVLATAYRFAQDL